MNFCAIKHIVNPKRVIDIGANIGEFASSLGNICADVEITMIEANPNCNLAERPVGAMSTSMLRRPKQAFV